MPETKLSPTALAALRAVAAGQVRGSGNVYATGWFNYRAKDESGRERAVTATIESLQHRGLVARPPKFLRAAEPKVFVAQVTVEGQAALDALAGELAEPAPKPTLADRVRCPECDKPVTLRADGRVRAHKPRRRFGERSSLDYCDGSGMLPKDGV